MNKKIYDQPDHVKLCTNFNVYYSLDRFIEVFYSTKMFYDLANGSLFRL